ncbi:MAG TPA: hypothetical protein VII83_09285 [Gaiellaceae bacterium]
MRRFALLTLALAVTFLLVASAAASGRATVVHHFVAFEGGNLASGLQLGKSARGYCWEGSIADGRSDAWRCFRGNFILDPCFSNGRSSQPYVVCPAAPWSTRVTLLRLTKPLPLSNGNKGSRAATWPWGIVTSNRQRCLAATGATSSIAGQWISYYCRSGGSLLGKPNRHAPTWTIFFAAKGSHHLTRVAISDAWS